MLAIVIALAVVLLGATAFVVRKNILDGQRCDQVQADISSRGEVVTVGSGPLKVAVLGDSYTAGDLMDNYRDGWAYKMPAALSATVSVAGVGSTGFTAGGPCGDQSYPERVKTAVRTNPDVLLIQGGLNDSDSDPNMVGAKADFVLRQAGAIKRVIVIGPVSAPAKSNLAAIDQQLAAAAKLNKREYVSALDWNLEFLPDRVHLTPAGHAEFARRVAAAVNP